VAGEQEMARNSQMLQIPYFNLNNIIHRKRGRLIGVERWKGASTKHRAIKTVPKSRLTCSKRGTVSVRPQSYSNARRHGKYLCVVVVLIPA